MGSLAPTSWIGLLLQLLPARVLRAADAWSHRVALRRQEQRRERWSRRSGRK